MSDEIEANDEPRAMTVEEMRSCVLGYVRSLVNYWCTTDLTMPEFASEIRRVGEIRWRMEGLIHSVFVMLDGGSGLPAFSIAPDPHPSDEEFHHSEGDNWWPRGIVLNECQLHEIWARMTR